MHPRIAAASAACALVVALAPAVASAQEWNDARTLQLVVRATERRAQQLADTGLRDYKSVAHGYVTFLAQLGEGLTEPPKVVKADELVNEVYWLAPNLSKQRILGRRDTLLLPTDISYHRDHLGIVQNNFPQVIRLGDGDEVLDVPHPLSQQGLAAYDFALTSDSVALQLPGRSIWVLEVKVRPKNEKFPRIVGVVYITSEDAQVVRMAFNFTRAAFRDDALEDLFVVIENRLIGGRFWLPSKQEIEIRRGGTWLDYPVRGIIRGRWDIQSYDINVGLRPDFFTGPEIVLAPKAAQDTFHFQGRVLDSLPPEVRAVTDAEIKAVQAEARNLVRAQALRRPQTLSLAATGISDFVRFNRVEGLAIGGGLASRFGGGFGAQARARYGVDDRAVKGSLGLDWQSPQYGIRMYGLRDFRQAGDVQERSSAVNSLAAQEFGSDYSDPYLVCGGGIGFDANEFHGLRWHFDATIERQSGLGINATPAVGQFGFLVPALPLRAVRTALRAEKPTTLAFLGTEFRGWGEVRLSEFTPDSPGGFTHVLTRAYANLQLERPFESGRLAMFLAGGALTTNYAGTVPQELLYFGGTITAPGYRYHEIAATEGATARAEWRFHIPAPSISLGRFGKIPGEATVAPFAQATYAHLVNTGSTSAPHIGYPSVGIALQPFFDLLRLQVARGLRKNGQWILSIDASRDLWSVL